MGQFTRRIIGFAVHQGDINGIDLYYMFNRIISNQSLNKRISTDNDPLFNFQMTPENKNTGDRNVLSINDYTWKKYLNGLVQLPVAA